MERRLAAILAADVVGYSRLMGADEEGVLAALKDLRAKVFDPLIATHHGRIVKLMGDGALVEFASVVDAVTCAAEVQREMAARNASLPENKRLELRIGVNLGDVMIDDGDIYGDGVNVAARLESLADPGGVFVSGDVASQAGGKAPVGFVDLGERRLKNIAEPVRVYRLDLDGAGIAPRPLRRRRRGAVAAIGAAALAIAAVAVWNVASPPGTPDAASFNEMAALARPTGPTVAVMPFENLGGAEEQAYLADGLSEDLIVELGRYRDLNVLSRQTTAAYRGKALDVRRIGRALGADYVLEGTVRQTGERLRVTARLIDAATGSQVWSGAFDEQLSASNLFDVQIRITERAASAVADSDGAIKRIDARRARTKPPEKLSSYECSMARHELLYSRALQERVRDCIFRVVEEEPEYWRGWAQLADALRTDVMIFANLYEGEQDEKLRRALEAARTAVSLNPEYPRAYFILGHILLLMGDREGFNAAAESALSLGGDRDVEARLGYWFVWTGRRDLGAALLQRAIALNPRSTRENWHRGLAYHHFLEDDYEAALIEYRKGAQPDLWWSVALEVAIMAKLDRTEDMRAAVQRLYKTRPGVKISDIVWLYRRFQRPEADTAKFVEAFRKAGIPEGDYEPLKIDGSG